MRDFRVYFILILGISVGFSSGGTTKEHKKKLFEKLRAALNASEIDASPVASIPSAEELEKVVESESPVAEVAPDEIVLATETDNKVETTEVAVQPTPNYLARFRIIVTRVLEMLGLRRSKSKEADGRKSRMLDLGFNDVDHAPIYRDEVRATVGAVLGQKECIQKVACVSGSFLKDIKAKQFIFALLESFSPNMWKETVKIAKLSAISEDTCDYKCLE